MVSSHFDVLTKLVCSSFIVYHWYQESVKVNFERANTNHSLKAIVKEFVKIPIGQLTTQLKLDYNT